MFEYIHLKNFKSFDDITFNLTDNKGNPKKMVLIYGENGIGKSNLASAFFFLAETLRTMNVRDIIQSILSDKPNCLSEDELSKLIYSRYKDTENLIAENKMVESNDPMLVEVGFKLNNRSGNYSLEFSNNQLIHEHLEYVLEKNRRTYFDITPVSTTISPKIFLDKTSYKEIKNACSQYWGKHTLLSILLHEIEDKADSYIKSQISINFQIVLSFLTALSCKITYSNTIERGRICLPDEILDDFDEGELPQEKEKMLDKTENMLNAFFHFTNIDIKRVYYKRIKKNGNILYRLMVTKRIAGKERNLDFSRESTGTLSLLQLLPFMLVVLTERAHYTVSVIDEFDTGIHELLEAKLIGSLYNSINGQLIITTHSTQLMRIGLPNDCIYIINNKKTGSKSINTITYYDKKISVNTNIRNQYLQGKYKGIPEPSDEAINLYKLIELLHQD